ncbi:hypothetical protein U2E72_13165 [Acinetobacter baumannii]|uniref:hypothetical protein n=1 Tax=Acinetobacter baumannii TaxID=470 RepID=UPI0008941466|nr:hypothetical protein [Acinetobacter baumannii]EKV1658196.1 hypothetical protein [Acinetobacter baumannii]EKV1847107.1 hypothetical protein [Acinetobacter baumannii]EKV4645650.1 hypothetical protein [Acinetobacter baumannii]MBF6833657.1 hypothetical protein [Acinetobacter baumannii]MDC4480818.1 hypothetical protein [Acinetobacter baumannii]
MFGLLVRLGVVVSIPAVSLFRRANAGQLYNDAISLYSNELIIGLCLLMMCVGCLASVLTPDPDGVTPIKPLAKFVYSLFGSLGALFYIAYYESDLSIVHPAWVGGVSFVAPAIVPSLKALVFDVLPVAMDFAKKWIDRWLGGKGGNHE